MADLILIEQLRQYLIDEGAVQAGETADDYVLPRCWLDPEDGAPEPAKAAGELTTVTLAAPLVIPGAWQQGVYLEERVVDVLVRSVSSPRADLTQRQIRGLLEEKKHVYFGDLLIEWSKLWRGDQSLASDETSYTRMQSFRIAARLKSLAGTPLVP